MAATDSDPFSIGRRERTLNGLAALGPGLLVVALGFHAGGFYPGTTGIMCIAVAVLLVGRLTLAERPAAGVSRANGLVLGALALLAALALLSALWSDAPARAMVEWNRVLLYAGLFALGAWVPYAPGRLRAVLWSVLAGSVVVVGAGVLSRVAPDVLATGPGAAPDRLSYPVGYWNGLGLLGAVGAILAVHAAADAEAPRPVRVLGAAVLPLLALGVYLTLSRGAVLAGLGGLAVFALAARPRALVLALLCGGIPAAAVVAAGTRADLLTSPRLASEAAARQGHDLATVLVIAMLAAALGRALALSQDRRVERADGFWRVASRTIAAAVVVGVVVAVVAGAPSAVAEQYRRFVDPAPVASTGAARFTQVANNGRIPHWRVAWRTWKEHPLAGTGAGTYETEWFRRRDVSISVVHAHSLELGVLSDLGVAGLALLAVALGAMLAGVAWRARGRDRAVQGALLGVLVAWLLHSAIDWTWELPGATAWLFPAVGLALARPAGGPREPGPGPTTRLVAALGVLVLAVVPALMALSQNALGAAVRDLRAGDCRAAISAALSSTRFSGARPEPFAVLGICDVRIGRPALAVLVLERAVARDPDFWEYRYLLALARGAAGQDPRADARRARALNPRSALTRDAVLAFDRARGPAGWRRAALRAQLP